jgi:5-methyltetrahydrofolate--homocysteine methyltransferase
MTTQDIFNAVLAFDEETVKAKTQAELDGGTDIESILNDGLISAMDEVGERFSAGELFVPEMLMAAQAMKAGLRSKAPPVRGPEPRARAWWSSARSRATCTTSARTWSR